MNAHLGLISWRIVQIDSQMLQLWDGAAPGACTRGTLATEHAPYVCVHRAHLGAMGACLRWCPERVNVGPQVGEEINLRLHQQPSARSQHGELGLALVCVVGRGSPCYE
jgi:hypothetical protein